MTDFEITLGDEATCLRATLCADGSLERVAGADADGWRSRGERAAFSFRIEDLEAALPAGWYWFEASLYSLDDVQLFPSLTPTYRRGFDGDSQIVLPSPGSDGRVRALVLFKYEVSALQISPGFGQFQFRLGAVRLRRVGRLRALAEMLRPQRGGIVEGGRAARSAVSFFLESLRRGVSGATACAYADYLLRVRSDGPSDYQNWVRRFDTLSADGMEALLRREAGFGARRPLISILLPTYQTPERWLRRCIESVQRQIYQDWQLCIADDASPDPTVMKIIAEYASSDKRIRYVRREANGHISETSNSALALAQGDWIALLDHDDELRPHALLEIAARIRDQPGAKMVYSDEDKMDLEGRRFDPYFKPDFDIDLLRGQNYICHFTAIRRELALEVGGFRSGFEGSQDHDLFLRCVERLSPVEVAHIPKVLYHWRAIPGSTALSRDAKDYAGDAGARAVEDHLLRTGAGASVEQLSHGHYRVRWPIPEPAPLVSLVVPTRDRVELLRVCVESILERTSYRNFELVVVDNGSTDPESLAYLASLTAANRAKVLRYDEPFNYSRINNWAVQQARGEILALINNDIEVISPDWLGEMVSHAIRPGVGAVGAMLYYPDETIQHAGVILGIDGVAAHIYSGMPRGYPGHGGRARVVQGMSAVTAACMVVSRAAYEAVGGLDEGLEVAFNDIDFCLRLGQAGYRNVWTPFAEMYHHESASRGHEDTAEKKARFAGEVELMRSRWAAILQEDPAYNVNLSLKSRYFDLAIPPRVPMWEAAPD